jgi:hypothetical protein
MEFLGVMVRVYSTPLKRGILMVLSDYSDVEYVSVTGDRES